MSVSIESGDLFEVRSYANTKLGLCIWYGSKTDGDPVRLDSAMGYNDQKWTLTNIEEGAEEIRGWEVRNLVTGKLAVVNWPTTADPFVNGQPIVQYGGGGTNGHWTMEVLTETVTIDGIACPVVRFISKGSDGVAFAYSTSARRAELHTVSATDSAQKWVLYPTLATDDGIPAPHSLGVSEAVYGESGGNIEDNASPLSFAVHPFWSVASAFANGSTFLIRTRSRFMESSTSSWGGWASWSDWTEAAAAQQGTRFWLSGVLEVTIGSTRKLAQVEFEVRTARVRSGVTYVGPATRQSVTFYPRPVTEVTSATWTPEGLRLALTTNYSRGATTIRIDSISGLRGVLAAPDDVYTVLASPAVIEIPQDGLNYIPDEGETLEIAYRVGSDQMPLFDGEVTATKNVAYTAGSVPGVEPEFTDAGGRSLAGTIEGWDDARLWVYSNGVLTECERGGDGVFTVLYPFNSDYELFAAGRDGSDWFAWHADMPERSVNAHAWNWDGGYAEITGRNVPMEVSVTTSAQYKALSLGARPYQVASGIDTRKQSWDVSGGVFDGYSASGRTDMDGLANTHAIYRSPYGDVIPVYVESVKWTQRGIATEADVSMVREAE